MEDHSTGASSARAGYSGPLLSAIVDSSQDAIISETLEGVITSWNPAAEQIFGYSTEEAVGRSIAMLMPPDRADEQASIMRWLRQGLRLEPFETQRVRKNGATIDISCSVSPIRNATGEVVGAAAVDRDISDRKRAEADRRSAETRLHQAERMETLGQLAGGVAHDFNNILAAMMGYAELISEATEDRPDVHSDVEQILDESHRAAKLVRDLLVFSKRQPATPEPADLNEIISGTRDLIAASTSGLTVRYELSDSAPGILADRSQLEQVLLNLAVNARDAMPGGGTLTIATGAARLDYSDAVLNPDIQPGRYAELTVSDTGTGMSPEVTGKIFEPFFTTKPTGKGTGLGLATVYAVISQAGGAITVDSHEGTGSTFHLYLPARTVPAHPAPQVERPPAAVAGHGERVLVVDDEPGVLAATSRMLRQLGYSVYVAATRDEALSIAAEHDLQLVLTDTVMPDITGPALAARISQMKPGIPILHMSGYSPSQLGHDDSGKESDLAFIQKPFTTSRLSESVHAALADQRTAN